MTLLTANRLTLTGRHKSLPGKRMYVSLESSAFQAGLPNIKSIFWTMRQDLIENMKHTAEFALIFYFFSQRIDFSLAVIFQQSLQSLELNVLESLETYWSKMFEHHIKSVENHCTHCRTNKNPPKASLLPVALSGYQTHAKHRVGRVWSGLIQSHVSPPCCGGQGHPSATSTCQRR